jgi:EF hand
MARKEFMSAGAQDGCRAPGGTRLAKTPGMKTAILLAALGFVYTFDNLDYDRDGVLTWQEARFADDLARNYGYADRDGDTLITRAEFGEAMAMDADIDAAGPHSARKREIFAALDADGDRALTPREALPQPALAAAFAHADTNGDGRVDRAEFGEVSLDLLGNAR